MRRYLALKREMAYVPEAEVRRFFAEQTKVYAGKTYRESRNEIRGLLASKKFLKQLDEWLKKQVMAGKVVLTDFARAE